MHLSLPTAPVSRPSGRLAVAGGCGGIGRALVAAALVAGARVAVLDLAASLERHPPPAGALAVPVDAADRTLVDAAFSEAADALGGLDGCVNLCGFMADAGQLAATPEPVWREVMAGNLDAAQAVSAAAMPLLAAGDEGAMVHVASGLGVVPRPGYGPYAVAKAGIIMLTRMLAIENAPRVRVNAVAPSAVDTAFLRGGTGRSDEVRPSRLDVQAYGQAVPLGRIAEADDIVGPILFLLSDHAGYVTGQTLHVNGGTHMA